MNRRDAVIGLLALGAGGMPHHVLAQSRARKAPVRIGVLYNLTPLAHKRAVTNMARLGWREQDFTIFDSGIPYEPNQIEESVKRIIARAPDIIIVISTSAAVAAQRLTKTIPIVMRTSGYPVEAGVADSLARPGKNVTGITNYAGTAVWAKLLELLVASKRDVKRVGVLWSYVPPAFPAAEIEPCYREIRQGAQALGVAVNIVEVATRDRFPSALHEIAAERPDALLLTAGMAGWPGWDQTNKFATERRLPTIVDWVPRPEDFKKALPLLAYGPDQEELTQQAFNYVDRILRGANPAVLPIQLPAKFDLMANKQMATAIGLTLPRSILLRASRVID